ncbi:lipopolysaccharide biosynthesis protein [Acidipila sp. EB88]|uniref:lipopolysaccharide biosynthesis protein n=1 Tax=Acidipila sp. EB88 TaxID=2305226 RepID=UPI000F5EADC8|nr:MATE family efflux transporter [Acidipila sp. EB88]RRA49059.1 MATE family efflux transporter [Acidipila sp. EB88]
MATPVRIAAIAPPAAEQPVGLRARQRVRRVTINGFTSIFAKLIVLATTIISVPLTYHYLGAERYGLWMTVTSLILFLGFADFGVGNGLTAAISAADGRDDHAEAQRQVTCGFLLLTGVCCCLLLAGACAYHFIPWASLYGTRGALACSEAGPVSAILIVCTALSMPVGTVLRVQLGYQQGFVADLWNAAGNLLALGGILLATHLRGGLPALVCAVAGAPLLATTCNCAWQFFRVRPWLRPRLALFDLHSALRLASVGGLFFLQQCFGLIYYVSDNVVISRTLGAREVAQYAVLQRIFSMGLVAQYFMLPLWPAIGEALTRHDYAWARQIARRAILFSLGLGLACGSILLLISRTLMLHWSGIDLGSVDMLRLGFAVWVVLVGYIAAMNALLNQPRTMRRHLVLFGSAAILSLVFKIVAARHGSLAGVVWATDLTFGILYAAPAALLVLRSLTIQETEARPRQSVAVGRYA